MNIIYPKAVKPGATIGITAPSSGIAPDLEKRLQFCIERIRSAGFRIKEGRCLRSEGIVSASSAERANELMEMLSDPSIDAIVPPWGGELLINALSKLDFDLLKTFPPKWIVGYSDMSTFLLPYTIQTGIATIHGSNFMETPFSCADGHWHWLDLIGLSRNDSFLQRSAVHYQRVGTRYQDFPYVAELNCTEPVNWKILGRESDTKASVVVSGRLIGGCLECVSMLPGTPYGGIAEFGSQCATDGLLIYLENCEEKATSACRMLHHLRLAGWFEFANGVLIGRTQAPDTANLSQREALVDVFGDLDIPIIYDMDIGHVSPQLLLVNGAMATVKCGGGKNLIEQTLV